MKCDELPVYRLTYSLVIQVVSFVKNFPKDYKFTLGDKIKDECFTAITLIYRANSNMNNRKKSIESCLERIKVIEMLLRLSRDLQIISTKQYSESIDVTDQIGRQLWGWAKSSS